MKCAAYTAERLTVTHAKHDGRSLVPSIPSLWESPEGMGCVFHKGRVNGMKTKSVQIPCSHEVLIRPPSWAMIRRCVSNPLPESIFRCPVRSGSVRPFGTSFISVMRTDCESITTRMTYLPDASACHKMLWKISTMMLRIS